MNKRLLILSSLIASLLFLSACTGIQTVSPTNQPPVQTASKEAAWKMRNQSLSRKVAWTLNSKIALRYQAENWNFSLKWLQKALNQYQMDIKNPLTGSVVARLSKTPQSVSLLSNDGKTYRDTDEERLLQRQSSVNLPLKGMQYWVRGLASPTSKIDKLVLDAQGRPIEIQQAGWKIVYSRYLNNRFDSVPTKAVITRAKDDVYLKMIAKSWQGV